MNIVLGIMLFEGLLFIGAIVLLIVLIIRRVEEKKDETFEKRDN